jgi:hypothetical protein
MEVWHLAIRDAAIFIVITLSLPHSGKRCRAYSKRVSCGCYHPDPKLAPNEHSYSRRVIVQMHGSTLHSDWQNSLSTGGAGKKLNDLASNRTVQDYSARTTIYRGAMMVDKQQLLFLRLSLTFQPNSIRPAVKKTQICF